MGAIRSLEYSCETGLAAAAEDPYIEAVLDDWRRRALDLLITLSAVAYLPGIFLDVSGLGIPITGPTRALLIVCYLAILAAAVFRRIDYRIRVCALVGLSYGLAIIGSIAYNNGPFMRAFPIFLAIMLLVLNGERGGKIGALISAVVIMFTPLVDRVPGLVETFAAGTHTPLPLGTVFSQGSSLVAMLLAIMFVIMRFHRFLIQTLIAEHHATRTLEQGAAELLEAHQTLASEMEARRRLEREIARIGDEERRNLGQDLHDGVCQQLTGALLRCQSLQHRLERGEALTIEDLTTLYALLDHGIDEAHAVSQGLCPLEPDPGALAPALRTLAKRTQAAADVRCDFVSSGDVNVSDPNTAQHLYRIAQEALSNAARHARARRITLEFCGSDGELLLQVRDDGIGLPDRVPAGGMGLRTMSYRAQILEGELVVEGRRGGGTQVTCRVPRRQPAPDHPARKATEEILP